MTATKTAFAFILLSMGFIELYHIHFHSHCTPEKARCEICEPFEDE